MPKTPNSDMVKDMLSMAERFNRDLLGVSVPEAPQMLSERRTSWALTLLNEELDEFKDAETVADQADAMVDLVYFALGRLVEMGVTPRVAFEAVHKANMLKQRGEKPTRSGGDGFDAIKPIGWTDPNLMPLLSLTTEDLQAAYGLFYDPEEEAPKPKLLIIGHGRHGKDTVCEILRDEYGFDFMSSSMFCAEKVVMPVMNAEGANYVTAQECFDDRHHESNRAKWFDIISRYNAEDPGRLGRELLAEHDVYCGLRSKRELNAVKNEGLVDAIIWVDASKRHDPEDKSSCDVEEFMADFTIDNNGNLDDLHLNVAVLMSALGVKPNVTN